MLKTNKYKKNYFFCPSTKMQNLSLKELRLIAKIEISMATKICLKMNY